jgi:hypothetical protein
MFDRTHDRPKVRVTWVVGEQGPVVVPQSDIPVDTVSVLDPQLGDSRAVGNKGGRDRAIRGVKGDGCEWTTKRVGPGRVLRCDASGQQGEYSGTSGCFEHVDGVRFKVSWKRNDRRTWWCPAFDTRSRPGSRLIYTQVVSAQDVMLCSDFWSAPSTTICENDPHLIRCSESGPT